MLLVLLVLLPVLRALVRGLSKMGYWGSEYEVENIIDGLGFLVVIALMIFFARVTLVEEQGDDMITRFLPPFLVIIGGFFLLDPQVGRLLGLNEWTSYILTTFVELFSQLFHWALIALSIRSLNVHPYRVVGIGYAVYGVFSIAYALLLQDKVELSSVLIVLAMYLFIVVMMLLFRSGRAKGEQPAERKPAAPAGGEELFHRIAEHYGLSPRETEVFVLLAQGRNRTYIQNALFLAEGTVKTHTSRIYQKLGVSNRQDMITSCRSSTRRTCEAGGGRHRGAATCVDLRWLLGRAGGGDAAEWTQASGWLAGGAECRPPVCGRVGRHRGLLLALAVGRVRLGAQFFPRYGVHVVILAYVRDIELADTCGKPCQVPVHQGDEKGCLEIGKPVGGTVPRSLPVHEAPVRKVAAYCPIGFGTAVFSEPLAEALRVQVEVDGLVPFDCSGFACHVRRLPLACSKRTPWHPRPKTCRVRACRRCCTRAMSSRCPKIRRGPSG